MFQEKSSVAVHNVNPSELPVDPALVAEALKRSARSSDADRLKEDKDEAATATH